MKKTDKNQTGKEIMKKELLIKTNEQDINLAPKSQSTSKKLSNTWNYEELINQTKEIDVNSKIVKTELEYVEEDSRLRKEKIELIQKNYDNLNAKPLVGVDLYESYSLVLNKSAWNYNEIIQRDTQLTILDMALQVHLFLYEGKIIDIAHIQKIIKTFVLNVFAKIIKGVPIVLNPIIIFDSVRFDKSKILPVAVANPKLMPPLGVQDWDTIVDEDEEIKKIVSTFIKLLENALTVGHEVEFFQDTLLVRNVDGITSLYVSEKAAQVFNNSVIDQIMPEKPKYEALEDPFSNKK
ncbi:MMOB1620 family gliding machinery internal complex protein [[Mycoplasma] mobile]|uniref:Expressed protein n=1 Tax=Mycoplasma mobile (strain ATCC 43663 / 163K / NCTC 11711) TaxID=267748 RepID=Q6KIC8_MYCM1|nr:hypothetical protein [[Mycoplasma] mobile]AAT27648.1 expressed protein [Mycoplasma mobile 163K]